MISSRKSLSMGTPDDHNVVSPQMVGGNGADAVFCRPPSIGSNGRNKHGLLLAQDDGTALAVNPSKEEIRGAGQQFLAKILVIVALAATIFLAWPFPQNPKRRRLAKTAKEANEIRLCDFIKKDNKYIDYDEFPQFTPLQQYYKMMVRFCDDEDAAKLGEFYDTETGECSLGFIGEKNEKIKAHWKTKGKWTLTPDHEKLLIDAIRNYMAAFCQNNDDEKQADQSTGGNVHTQDVRNDAPTRKKIQNLMKKPQQQPTEEQLEAQFQKQKKVLEKIKRKVDEDDTSGFAIVKNMGDTTQCNIYHARRIQQHEAMFTTTGKLGKQQIVCFDAAIDIFCYVLHVQEFFEELTTILKKNKNDIDSYLTTFFQRENTTPQKKYYDRLVLMRQLIKLKAMLATDHVNTYGFTVSKDTFDRICDISGVRFSNQFHLNMRTEEQESYDVCYDAAKKLQSILPEELRRSILSVLGIMAENKISCVSKSDFNCYTFVTNAKNEWQKDKSNDFLAILERMARNI